MNNIKYQNYQHYKLPITLNPLKYGKLILNIGKQFVIQVNRTNIALITQFDNLNHVKFFKEGDFIFEYKDIKSNDSIFIRNLNNKKFTFENHILTLVEKPIIRIIIFSFIILLLQLDNFSVNNTEYLMLGTNIIKLRKISSKYHLKNNYYKETPIEFLIFSYGFKQGKIENKEIINTNVITQNYNNYKIPISMNPSDFGILVNQFIIENGITYILQNENLNMN